MWGLLFVVLCILRPLLLVMFLTFMLCYVIRSIINAIAARIWRNQKRPWLERLLVVGLFGMLFVGAWAAGRLLGPLALVESQELVKRVSKMDPDYEFHQVLNRAVGFYLFRQQYGGPDSPQYQKGFGEFTEQGRYANAAYDEFPTVEATVERTIAAKLEASQQARLSAKLARQQTSGQPRDEKSHVLAQQLEEIKHSADFQERVRAEYEQRRRSNSNILPYSYETYLKLKAAYPNGRQAFVAALRQSQTASEAVNQDQLRDAFEKEERRELATQWWADSNMALLVRHHIEGELDAIAGTLGEYVRGFVSGLLSLPGQIVTVLLLSFFITFDFPTLRSGLFQLKYSRLRFLFDDLLPGIAQIGNLIGKAFVAQGIIALINAGLTFVALTVLGVENPLLLAVVVFIFSFVPVLGVVLSAIPIALMAVLQPNGSLWLAVSAIGAILVIHLIEATILSPKIVGKMLHLHPVMGIVVLAIGEHFFGMWGLLFAYPVTVYLISRVISGDKTDVANQKEHR
jgi:predicted PurR-regulated permease PerM